MLSDAPLHILEGAIRGTHQAKVLPTCDHSLFDAHTSFVARTVNADFVAAIC